MNILYVVFLFAVSLCILPGCSTSDQEPVASNQLSELIIEDPAFISIVTPDQDLTLTELGEQNPKLTSTDGILRKDILVVQSVYWDLMTTAQITLMYHENNGQWYSAQTAGTICTLRDNNSVIHNYSQYNDLDFEIWSYVADGSSDLQIIITCGTRYPVADSPFIDASHTEYLFSKWYTLSLSDLQNNQLTLKEEKVTDPNSIIYNFTLNPGDSTHYSCWSTFALPHQNYWLTFDFDLNHYPFLKPGAQQGNNLD